ncbi:polyadenylate-binding protein-interacting protein 2B isoform X2 [Capricornis sumatraensis]|uniref:polyadenylate-binding protein-interacting protein 2B isoform X2 n=1 Tax=Capricornis sumatraensis TaxID=34865 RepID=UPI0036046373
MKREACENHADLQSEAYSLPRVNRVEEELQEQEFLDRCFQEMLDEEDQDWFIPSRDLPQAMGQLQQQLNGLSVSDGHASEDILSKSNLNPDAKEFVPGVKY